MKFEVVKFIYLLAGILLTFLGIGLSIWGYINSNFPEIEGTEKVIGEVTQIEQQGWRIDFKVIGQSKAFSYYRHYGNFDRVKDLMANKEKVMLEMNVEKKTASKPIIYSIEIDNIEVTNFEEKKSKHGEYIKSVYWFSVLMVLCGMSGIFMGTKKVLAK